ncbi:fumarylacetoacetate hydrolase family protein, partial [Bacillus sp. B190/17]
MKKMKIKLHELLEEMGDKVNTENRSLEAAGKHPDIESLVNDVSLSGTIYGTLLNYKGALEALGESVNEAPYKAAPKAPILYIKPVNTISSHGQPIPLPEGVSELEIGAALGVVIGRTATRVSEKEALDY